MGVSRNITGVETDVNLKRLFKACGKDFLWLTGDEEATLLSIDVLELQEIKRSVDCLMRLRRGGEVYYRHIEFQATNDPQIAERCFRYNALLLLELHAPVLTTVLYLVPPAPAESEIVYRVMLAGVEVNAWRFGVVRLWEVKAQAALASGAPGLMALVPFLEGGDPAAVWQAARRIRQLLPGDRMSDPEAILWLLARDRYNMEQMDVVIGRHHMQALLDLIKRSPLWQEAESEGEARGRLAAQREMCLRLVARHHPSLLAEAAPRIEACDNCDLLESWILAASEPDTETLARLIA
jgi:predicted transposase YdaD